MDIKIVETGGISLRSQIIRTDLTECVFPDCSLCDSETKGGSHSRRGAVYGATCELCEENGILATYTGETGHSAYHRTKEHKSDVRNENLKNALAKHMEIYHPEYVTD